MKLLPIFVFLLALSGGCHRAPPTMAGGKWAATLNDSDPRQRQKAAFTLGNIGASDKAAFPALLGALHDEAPEVRCEAILAILKFGQSASAAIPNLVELRDSDSDARVREYADKALAKLQKAK
jgi:HEAT repeat protein